MTRFQRWQDSTGLTNTNTSKVNKLKMMVFVQIKLLMGIDM